MFFGFKQTGTFIDCAPLHEKEEYIKATTEDAWRGDRDSADAREEGWVHIQIEMRGTAGLRMVWRCL